MTSIKKSLERVQLTDTQIKVIMPEKIFNQIQYLCRDIAKVEWSGILFYSIEGSIKDPANMVITLQDILPMHKGTATYTEYSFDERVVEHMMDHDYLEDCKIGHIHSHNTMGVFFSGTDWSELEDNAPNHNIYLSLIVNNFMDFCAKVCFIAETAESKEYNFEAKDENGTKYIYKKENFQVKDKRLVSYDCDIMSPKTNITVEDSFKEKVLAIIAKAEVKATPVTNYTPGGYPKTSYDANHYKDDFSGWDARNYSTPSTKGAWSRTQPARKQAPSWTDDNPFETPKAPSKKQALFSQADLDEVIENFCLLVLNTGHNTDDFADIEDIVEFYMKKGVTGEALAKNVLEKYVIVYQRYFADFPLTDTTETILDIANSVIELLQHEADTSTMKGLDVMLKPTIQGLTRMCIEIENLEVLKDI